MAAVQENVASDVPTAVHHVAHPLCPLSGSEIATAADLVRSVWPDHTDLRFKVVTLEEPAKKELAPYLEAEHNGQALPQLPRRAFVAYYIRNTVGLWSKILTGWAVNNAKGPLP